jgi:uncharacterized protein (DUF58 family)
MNFWKLTVKTQALMREPSRTVPELGRRIKLFEIRARRLIARGLAGEYRSVFRGRGIEFDEVRAYAPGDDVRLIDWNVSARAGGIYIKKHIEEREQTVLLLVDVSASSDFGTRAQTKRELIAELCCVLGLAAAAGHDRTGLLLFTDRVEHFVPPARGRRHALRLVRDLLGFQPVGRATDISLALDYLNGVRRQPAVVFLVSDFINPSSYERSLRIAARRHDLVAVVVSDVRERELPPVGLVELRDVESGERVLVDTSDPVWQQGLRARLEAEKIQRAELFRRSGVDYIELETGEAYEAKLRRFLVARSKKWHFA